ALRIAGALRVLAQRELDARRGPGENHFLRALAPPHLQRQRLPADRVGRTVQDVGGGHAARQRAVDRDVVRVDDIPDVHHRGNRNTAFVDAAVAGDVRVAIDDTGDEILPA